jgi:hypothetical protein
MPIHTLAFTFMIQSTYLFRDLVNKTPFKRIQTARELECRFQLLVNAKLFSVLYELLNLFLKSYFTFDIQLFLLESMSFPHLCKFNISLLLGFSFAFFGHLLFFLN